MGQGRTRWPNFCLQPQALLVSCFASVSDLAATQDGRPPGHTCMCSFLGCFVHFSPWLMLPLMCLLPAFPACPLQSPFSWTAPAPSHACHRMFLSLPRLHPNPALPKVRGYKDSLLFLSSPKARRAGWQQDRTLLAPLLLCAFSLVLAWETPSFSEAPWSCHSLPHTLPHLTGHVPTQHLKCAVRVNIFQVLVKESIKCLNGFILVTYWNVRILWISWVK